MRRAASEKYTVTLIASAPIAMLLGLGLSSQSGHRQAESLYSTSLSKIVFLETESETFCI